LFQIDGSLGSGSLGSAAKRRLFGLNVYQLTRQDKGNIFFLLNGWNTPSSGGYRFLLHIPFFIPVFVSSTALIIFILTRQMVIDDSPDRGTRESAPLRRRMACGMASFLHHSSRDSARARRQGQRLTSNTLYTLMNILT
jgi:hypothetical protein